jgi:hypothetical protein
VPRTNKGCDSGAAAFAALKQEINSAKAAGQEPYVQEVIPRLKRRGFTKEAIGRALVLFEQHNGRFKGSEASRREVRRGLMGLIPPAVR